MKLKENNGKMKKIEASMIKRLMRISSQLLSVLAWSPIFYSLSHTLAHLDFSWSTLEALWHTLDLEQEGKGRARKCKRTMGSTTTMGLLCKY